MLVALFYNNFIWKIFAHLCLAHSAAGQVFNVLSAEASKDWEAHEFLFHIIKLMIELSFEKLAQFAYRKS